MILAALNDYYQRLQSEETADDDLIAPLGFSIQKITFTVILQPDGRLVEIEDARLPDPKDRKGKRRLPRPLVVPGGAKPSGSGLNPCFLWDNSGYLLGFKPNDPNPERTAEAFAAFRKRHLSLEKEIDDPHFAAVCRFLESWNPKEADQHPVLKDMASGFGVFRIRGQKEFVHERPAVRRWWFQHLKGRAEAPVGQCLVTGQHGPLARIHEPRIKGVLDAQSSGATLVSFNFDATESYGKVQSYNAPVGEEAAFRYANALNHLLRRGSRQRVQVGDATTVFWTAQPTAAEQVFGIVFQPGVEDENEKAKVVALLRRIARGQYPQQELGQPQTPFYVLGLAANAARLSVRFWHVSTLQDMVDRLRRHYADLTLDGRADWEPEFPTVQDLLDQTARERKDIPPLLGGALMRAILEALPYPDALYLAVLRRIRADQRIGYVRAAILKAYLNRNHGKEVPVALDVNRPEPAYHLGRLFAALEKIQEDALPELNDTIKDRYFGAASATPRTVFPRLLRLKQHHIGKLDNPGLRIAHEKRLQEIMDHFRDFPAHLNLEDQGLFAIGYYHQRKDLFTKKDKEN
jgi:CRISPR-associated protein Csd1